MREPAERDEADEHGERRGDRLGDDDGDERRIDAVTGSDRDRDEAQGARAGLVDAAEVVAAVEQECRGADLLRGLHEREQRRREQGGADAVRVEDPVREGHEGEEDHRRQRSADELEDEHLPEEAPEAPPVLRRDIAEAVLRQRLLDGEVEQRLEEPDCREHRREDAEPVQPEHAGRDDRAEESERDSGVDPRGRRRPAPEDARGHRGVSVCRGEARPGLMAATSIADA